MLIRPLDLLVWGYRSLMFVWKVLCLAQANVIVSLWVIEMDKPIGIEQLFLILQCTLLPPANVVNGTVFGHVCLYVCLSCFFSNYWKPWPRTFIFWYAGTSLEYLGHIRVSRSLDQGQGHSSKKRVCCLCVVLASAFNWKAVLLCCEFTVGSCRTACRSTYNHASGDAYKMPTAHVSVTIGQLCAARYSGTNEWHRCYIIEILRNKVQVASSLTANKCAYSK